MQSAEHCALVTRPILGAVAKELMEEAALLDDRAAALLVGRIADRLASIPTAEIELRILASRGLAFDGSPLADPLQTELPLVSVTEPASPRYAYDQDIPDPRPAG